MLLLALKTWFNMAPTCQKKRSYLVKGKYFCDPESYSDEAVEIARGTCEHSKNAWLQPSYALVVSGATSKVVSKNIVTQ